MFANECSQPRSQMNHYHAFRKFGKLDWNASVLGFGCMRLPTVDGIPTPNINEAEAVRTIHNALDRGVNYFDTAYPSRITAKKCRAVFDSNPWPLDLA